MNTLHHEHATPRTRCTTNTLHHEHGAFLTTVPSVREKEGGRGVCTAWVPLPQHWRRCLQVSVCSRIECIRACSKDCLKHTYSTRPHAHMPTCPCQHAGHTCTHMHPCSQAAKQPISGSMAMARFRMCVTHQCRGRSPPATPIRFQHPYEAPCSTMNRHHEPTPTKHHAAP